MVSLSQCDRYHCLMAGMNGLILEMYAQFHQISLTLSSTTINQQYAGFVLSTT